MSDLMHPAAEQSFRSTRRVGTLPLWQLKRVTDFIEANIPRTIHVGDLAAVANLSTGHFTSLFRRATGESPLAYLRRRRIERAQEMLLAGDESLAGIALACGLSDQSHLTKLFRRLVGSTPAVWRREQRRPQGITRSPVAGPHV